MSKKTCEVLTEPLGIFSLLRFSSLRKKRFSYSSFYGAGYSRDFWDAGRKSRSGAKTLIKVHSSSALHWAGLLISKGSERLALGLACQQLNKVNKESGFKAAGLVTVHQIFLRMAKRCILKPKLSKGAYK